MTRQPATLSCLAIVNPTLRAAEPDKKGEDGEDADQRAQILFYTSKEHTVSQGKMLRQVGLAQALIAFSANLCGTVDAAQDIHTLKSRMTLISPESDHWIYADFDLGRSQYTVKRRNAKGKAPEQPSFEYHDSALHDEGLQAHLLKSYEEFKLLHGTFGMILRDKGRNALESLLERHFTQWAWAWDVEHSTSQFDRHSVNLPMHPQYVRIAGSVDVSTFPSLLELPVIILEPPYILWSPQLTPDQTTIPPSLSCKFPLALALYLLKLLTPGKRNPIQDILSAPSISLTTAKEEDEQVDKQDQAKSKPNFRVPPMTMDPRKWALGALLTTPPSWMSRSDKDSNAKDSIVPQPPNEPASGDQMEGVQVGTLVEETGSDLSDSRATIRRKASSREQLSGNVVDQTEHRDTNSDTVAVTDADRHRDLDASATVSVAKKDDTSLDPIVSLHRLTVYLSRCSEEGDPLQPRAVGYVYLKDLNLIISVLLPEMDADNSLDRIIEELNGLIKGLRPTLEAAMPDKKTPSSTKIFASHQGVYTSEPPSSKFSEQAFDTWKELHHPEFCEVLSRPSTNNRPWTAAKRELNAEGGSNVNASGSVYLELMGSDATMVDVDRSLSTAHSEWCT